MRWRERKFKKAFIVIRPSGRGTVPAKARYIDSTEDDKDLKWAVCLNPFTCFLMKLRGLFIFGSVACQSRGQIDFGKIFRFVNFTNLICDSGLTRM